MKIVKLFQHFRHLLSTNRLVFFDVPHQDTEGIKQAAEKSSGKISKQETSDSLLIKAHEKEASLFENAKELFTTNESLAKDPDTHPSTIRKLANSKSMYIRSDISSNPNTPPDVLSKLSRDSDDGIRFSVANNPNTPLYSLVSMFEKDSDQFALSAMKKRLNGKNVSMNVIGKLLNHKDNRLKVLVAESKNVPGNILKKLVEVDDYGVRMALATNPKTPSDALVKLAEKAFSKDRVSAISLSKELVKNSSLSASVIRKIYRQLSSFLGSTTHYRIASHPNTPKDILNGLINRTYKDMYADRVNRGEMDAKDVPKNEVSDSYRHNSRVRARAKQTLKGKA